MRFLVIDDNPDDRWLLIRELRQEFPDAHFEEIVQRDDFDLALAQGDFDMVLTDYHLGWTDGLWIMRQIRERDPQAPIIMVTGSGNEEVAVQGFKQGLSDYILKGHLRRLPVAVRESLEKAGLDRERARTEEALRKAKEFSDSLIASMQDGFSVLDTHGVHLDVNPALCQMTGFSREELIGAGPPHPYWPPEAYEEIERTFQKTLRGEFGGFELTFRRKNGERFPVIVSPSWMKDAQGNVVSYFATVKDITDRKRAEEALREEEQQLSLIFDNVSDVLFYLAVEPVDRFRFVSVNKIFLQATGLAEEQIIGKEIREVIPQPAHELVLGKYHEAIRERRTAHWEEISIYPAGKKYGEVSVTPVFDAAGHCTHLVGTVHDVTENRIAQERIRASEEKYRSLFENANDAIYLIDPATQVILDCNGQAARMDGYSLDELKAMRVVDLHPADERPLLPHKFKEVSERGSASGISGLHHLTKDGRIVPVEVNAALIEIGGRKLNLSVVRDITERKRAEEALRESRQVLERTLYSLRDAVFILNADSVEITDCNPAASEIFGYSREEMLGRTTTFLHVDEAALEEFRKHLYPAIEAKGFLHQLEFNMKRKDGTIFPTEHSVMPLVDEKGNRTGWVSVVRDITERKRLEAEREQLLAEVQRYATELEQRVAERTTELQAANRELEAFTYSVSHDLKAPLRGIDGYSHLLLQDYADKLDEEGRTFLYTIRSAAQQMNQLIDDLLAYSRLERRAMTTRSLNPRPLVEMLVAERADELQARQVTLSVDIPCATVTAEAEGLAEAVRNLLDNALKFTRDVPAPRIEIGGRETEKSCIIWVRDNGIGFDMQYHDRIFEIFQRLPRAEDYPGTGVGLAIVRKVMQRMGGRVWAESAPGEGATFYLEIPR